MRDGFLEVCERQRAVAALDDVEERRDWEMRALGAAMGTEYDSAQWGEDEPAGKVVMKSPTSSGWLPSRNTFSEDISSDIRTKLGGQRPAHLRTYWSA
uniref:Uncharacterized protein n=1 Tax=Mycena chlorophos TaxID=658473 RepID=A0ABQ0LJR7_MYCCL|nr:predicted protein [Mycena chlorophos]